MAYVLILVRQLLVFWCKAHYFFKGDSKQMGIDIW